jgi:hypothetical protein
MMRREDVRAALLYLPNCIKDGQAVSKYVALESSFHALLQKQLDGTGNLAISDIFS